MKADETAAAPPPVLTGKDFRERAAAIERCGARNILAVEAEAAALYPFAAAQKKAVLRLAHATNRRTVGQGDFAKEKGDGACGSLDRIATRAGAWRGFAPR